MALPRGALPTHGTGVSAQCQWFQGPLVLAPVSTTSEDAPELGIDVEGEEPAAMAKAARHVEADEIEEGQQAYADRGIAAGNRRCEWDTVARYGYRSATD